MKPKGIVAFGVLFVLGSMAQSLWSAQQRLGVDRRAVPKTHVPSINTQSGVGGAAATIQGQASSPSSTGGSPYSVGTANTPTSTSPELDEAIAIDPTNPVNLVAAVSDFSQGGFNITKFVVSYGNGAAGTWSESFVPLQGGKPATSDSQTWQANSNPVVAIDREGRVYITGDYLNVSNKANGLYVSGGNLGLPNLGLTSHGTIPVATNLDPNTSVAEDKDWIAVDNSNAATSGNVYVSWTRFVSGVSIILVSRSVNHGQTWLGPVKVNDSWQDGAVQGAQVAVGPAGEVYVVYEVFYINNQRQHFLVKSTDGGRTFSSSVAVSPIFNELSFVSTYSKNSFPSLAVNPINGHVYVVYSDQTDANASSEVEFVVSRDGGATFSAPVSIDNPSKGEQFMPAVTTDGSGAIHICWFDTRNNFKNTASYDIYASSSSNDGGKFSSNARVTASSIDTGNTTFIGNYLGIAARGGFVHPVWTSGGFNNGFLQTATLQ